MATLANDHSRVMDALFNGDDGQHGLIAWMARQDERADMEREFRDKRDRELKDALAQQNTVQAQRVNRLMAWMAFIGLLFGGMTLLIGLLVYLEGRRQLKSGELKLGDNVPAQVYAQSNKTKDAAIPHNP